MKKSFHQCGRDAETYVLIHPEGMLYAGSIRRGQDMHLAKY